MAAMFAIFVRVDERNSKSAKRGKKSKSSKINKEGSQSNLVGSRAFFID